MDEEKLYYEAHGTQFWVDAADPRNTGNQKNNKVCCPACAPMLPNQLVLRIKSSLHPVEGKLRCSCRRDGCVLVSVLYTNFGFKVFRQRSVQVHSHVSHVCHIACSVHALIGGAVHTCTSWHARVYIALMCCFTLSGAPCESTFALWRPFWVRLQDDRAAIGCVCVHHLTRDLLENAIRRLRCQCHRGKLTRTDGHACQFSDSCDCACKVCLDTVPLLQAAVCDTDCSLPRLPCALQECPDCGLEAALVCPRKENNPSRVAGKVRLMKRGTLSVPGYQARPKMQPVSVEEDLGQLHDDMREKFKFMLMHDYMARRLGAAFRSHVHNLKHDEEVWVMDYIENFSCFQEFAIQQDHYGHTQITIFVILCIRCRREGEGVEYPTFQLPNHLTCELHAFLSEDLDHDVGFAQLCMATVMDKKESEDTVPERVRLWTDGGRAHFKNFQMLKYMATLARRYGTKFWWCFFQSCHGKGMHDGAGAWIKAAVARACLAGVGIASVEDFFHFCRQFLNTNTSRSNFTSERHFYLISIADAAMFRASMHAQVTCTSNPNPTLHTQLSCNTV